MTPEKVYIYIYIYIDRVLIPSFPTQNQLVVPRHKPAMPSAPSRLWCSKACQCKAWTRHRFVCCGRPGVSSSISCSSMLIDNFNAICLLLMEFKVYLGDSHELAVTGHLCCLLLVGCQRLRRG